MEKFPQSWHSTPLSEIVEINPGIDKSIFRNEDEMPFVPMPAVEAETGRINTLERRPFGKVKSGFTPFASGDVLFAKITPCMENGKMAVVPSLPRGVGFGTTEFHVLRPMEAVDRKLLYFFVSSASVRHEAQHQMTGAVGQKRVPKRYLETKVFPLAPLNEQRRIVEKIETLFARLDKGEETLREVQKLLARYRQSVLKAAVTGLLTADWRITNSVPDWREIMLGDVTEFLTSGSRGWAKYYAPSGALFIRAQNLKFDRLDLDDVAFVNLPKKSEGTRTLVQRGDLLITITGANVTKTALVDVDIKEEAYVSQHVGLLRLKESADPKFIYWFLIAKAGGRKQLEEFAYGAGKPGLNLANIRDVRLMLPSIREQWEIVSRLQDELDRIQVIEDFCKSELTRSAALRQSILKDAFAGRLVPQDPSDEPASELLARIRAERAAGPAKRTRKRAKP
ncbi:restriction endonuclease subunit S [Desulfonatronum thiodismutans]|uniref:restriction endonuclease subunit S n=1 Tax=Desulfonatronum thiodismutans TaxID=159290 RepID=UPI0004ABECF8|nr:restriction endonuclease subunit S [Desulfonatronum thiodismutans]